MLIDRHSPRLASSLCLSPCQPPTRSGVCINPAINPSSPCVPLSPVTSVRVSDAPCAVPTECRRGQIKFSMLAPGTTVWPHTGPTNCRLRLHLGIKVPDGVGIRVAGEKRCAAAGRRGFPAPGRPGDMRAVPGVGTRPCEAGDGARAGLLQAALPAVFVYPYCGCRDVDAGITVCAGCCRVCGW